MLRNVEGSSSTPGSVDGHPHGRVPRAVREEQLLEVAEGVFAMQGYQGTSIEDIARAAGVTRPVVYDHFGSKENIYLACVRRARAELERLFDEAADPNKDVSERLWGGINAYLEFVERHGRAWDVLFGQGGAVTGSAGEELLRQRFATVDRIADLFKSYASSVSSRVDETAIQAFAHALSGSGEQLAKWWRQNPELTREQIAGYHMAFAWIGLEQLVARARGVAGERAPSSSDGS
jgi:AcrR family transcriptional regulator